MFSIEQHIEDLTNHVEMVRRNCIILGSRLIDRGQLDFGKLVIARGHAHDASKFHGIEWDYLHVGEDVDKTMLQMAIKQHVSTNSHHPEFHGGFDAMPDIDVAELVCDCLARSQEFGTNIREWFTKVFLPKYKISDVSNNWLLLQGWLDMLLKSSFKKM